MHKIKVFFFESALCMKLLSMHLMSICVHTFVCLFLVIVSILVTKKGEPQNAEFLVINICLGTYMKIVTKMFIHFEFSIFSHKLLKSPMQKWKAENIANFSIIIHCSACDTMISIIEISFGKVQTIHVHSFDH